MMLFSFFKFVIVPMKYTQFNQMNCYFVLQLLVFYSENFTGIEVSILIPFEQHFDMTLI